MAVLDFDADVRPFFATQCCDADEGLLKKLSGWVEGLAKKYVGHVIAQETITGELQRREDIGGYANGESFELVGTRVVYAEHGCNGGEILQLDNGFVRSITEIREDSAAVFGQGAADFGSATILTSGVDYALERDISAGISRSGRVHRLSRQWSSAPGTIKITYVAGLTAAELNAEYSFVKLALLEEMQVRFNRARSQRSAGGGPLRKVSYAGDVSYEYAVATSSGGGGSQLSASVMSALSPIKRMVL